LSLFRARYGILPSAAMPRIKRIPHITDDRKTNNFAIAAAPAAASLHPNIAAISAITKKIRAERSIDFTSPDMIRRNPSQRVGSNEQPRTAQPNCALKYDSSVMNKYIYLLICMTLFVACEQKETTVANPPAEKKESNTTVVNPPTQKKETNTTVINPSSPATETKEKTDININTSPSP